MSVDVFEGRPIEGDIQHYTEPTAQEDPALFLAALDELLSTPGVEAVRWNQYTPYFNDGEPCVFSIYGACVKIAGDAEEEAGDYGDGFRGEYDLFDYDPSKGDTYESRKTYNPIGGYPSKMIADALDKFESVLNGGAHYNILGRKFGDPAQVTATPDGAFSVEFYEHD